MTQQCHWFIHVRPGHKVLLYFEEFEVEGKPEGESNQFLINIIIIVIIIIQFVQYILLDFISNKNIKIM